MKLILDLNESIETLVENTSSGKKYYIEGKFLSADMPNKNGRVYPKKVMESAVHNYVENYVSKNRGLGELNHPNGPSVNVNLDKVCHMIESLEFRGSDVYGKAKVMSTPMGEIVKTLIDEDVKLGVSSRGLGSIKKNSKGINEVQGDFFLAAVDVVNDPSGHNCFVNGIMEGSEWKFVNGVWVSINEEQEMTLDQRLDLFEKFLKKIK